ncbi:MAG: prohibitin family protein [Actinobacteria bacterium]|nr:prohibitin family protein [Actinomycetota bacterium]
MNVADGLRALATFAWVAAFAVIGLAVFRASRGQTLKAAGTLVGVVVAVALLLTVVGAGLVFIQPEERGVVVSALSSQGYRSVALGPGLHFIIPFAENVVLYPISRQTYTMSIASGEGQVAGDDSVTARTADGQEVFVDASVIYAIDPAKVVQVHIQWQTRYTSELVRPQARGIIRDVASQYGVQDIVTGKRGELVETIRQRVADKLSQNGLTLIDFVLRNITFSKEYSASIEQKQIAEQQAQQAKLVVEQRKQEAEQARQVAQGQADAAVIAAKGAAEARLINADAEAKALTLIAAALKDNPDLITYQYVQKLSPGIQVMLVPNNNPFLLPLPTLTPTAAGGTQP